MSLPRRLGMLALDPLCPRVRHRLWLGPLLLRHLIYDQRKIFIRIIDAGAIERYERKPIFVLDALGEFAG
jgi:hypothetical protein